VLVVGDRGLSSFEGEWLMSAMDAADVLCSAVRGAPRLSAVQLVLGSRDWKRGSMRRAVWRSLALLPQLTLLTLGWDVFPDQATNEFKCVYIATCLYKVTPRPCLVPIGRPAALRRKAVHGDARK